MTRSGRFRPSVVIIALLWQLLLLLFLVLVASIEIGHEPPARMDAAVVTPTTRFVAALVCYDSQGFQYRAPCDYHGRNCEGSACPSTRKTSSISILRINGVMGSP